jgi:hypothetical protein
MISFLLVTLIFWFLCVLHILLHRYLYIRGIHTFMSTSIYLAGLCGIGFMYTIGLLYWPMASVVYYVLLVMVAMIFYLTPYLGGETPASMILASFKKKRQQSFDDLVHLFTNTGLIWKRIEDLEKAGLVVKTGPNYAVTDKGRTVSVLVILYQKLFHRQLVG